VSERPLSVLHLATNRWWTGSADPTIQLVAALRARGHRVLLGVTPGDRFEAKAREAGLELVEGIQLRARLAPRELLRDARRLRALVRERAVEVIHTHHSHDHWLATLVARGGARARPAVVRTFHNLRAVKGDALARALYRRAAAVFAVSRAIEARCRLVGAARGRVYLTPGVADLSRFGADDGGRAVREEFKLGDAPVVVSVARLAPRRGHELLLAGFRELLADAPTARLLLVGKGEMRTRLEQLAVELGLAPQVVFTGYRDRDLPAVLAAADCFALMAAGSDDSCRAALEAMAAGRPVVARRVGALPETVVHGVPGVLVAEDTPAGVAAALRAVLCEPARARAMGAAGRRRAETEFSVARAAATVEGAYRDVVGAAR
jgi:glycosyltransferase involved in cell wall biosynthesis